MRELLVEVSVGTPCVACERWFNFIDWQRSDVLEKNRPVFQCCVEILRSKGS